MDGDVLILRAAQTSDGYQTYLFEELGFVVNSVETIVFHDQTTSEYVKNKIDKAEKYLVCWWKSKKVFGLLER